MSEATVPHSFQYSSARHQSGTSMAGMWLFVASESLFFGGLFLAWVFCRHFAQKGFDEGAKDTELWTGTINTIILITSSFVYATGLAFIRAGNTRRLLQCCAVTLALGLAFLYLKFGLEWMDDIHKHTFFADPAFKYTGPDAGGARLFYVFYFVSTALHGIHMVVGVGLVSFVMWSAWRGAFSARNHSAVEITGIYWSFVDMIWIVLYPLIYLIGRV
ncbi:MAG TPA: cytochrome c oxidase subunit 3 [Acetobacteraceae bacterium]|jgi:cytochrome c oxidase subunit 3